MKYAYLRVSKKDQNMNRQIDNLKRTYSDLLPCNIYYDKRTGINFERENYIRLKSVLSSGDELIVHELDRFGRNKTEIKQELEWLKSKGVIPRILNIHTTLIKYPSGQEWVQEMVHNILVEVYSTLAEQERELISRRTKEGLAAARQRGRFGGRPKKDSTDIKLAIKMHKDGYYISEITKAVNMSSSCFYKYLGNHVDDLLDIGKSIDEISSETGCTPIYIESRIYKNTHL